jgi:hypothetical protein
MATYDLSRPYAARDGAPVLTQVDSEIFEIRYFTRCMECGFCKDRCCQYGVDVDAENHARILARADAIEPFVGVPRDRWFTGTWTEDREYPGGKNTRTAVENGTCVFKNKNGRGCALHTFSLERGLDYHEIKPFMSSLFPLSFLDGLLCAAEEAFDGELVCLGEGPTVYRGVRDEVVHYFGEELAAELDAMEARAASERAAT